MTVKFHWGGLPKILNGLRLLPFLLTRPLLKFSACSRDKLRCKTRGNSDTKSALAFLCPVFNLNFLSVFSAVKFRFLLENCVNASVLTVRTKSPSA